MPEVTALYTRFRFLTRCKLLVLNELRYRESDVADGSGFALGRGDRIECDQWSRQVGQTSLCRGHSPTRKAEPSNFHAIRTVI